MSAHTQGHPMNRSCLVTLALLALTACTRAQPPSPVQPEAQAPAQPEAQAPAQVSTAPDASAPAEGATQPRWSVEVPDPVREELGSRLEVEEGGRRQVLIDLKNDVPAGPDGLRGDLRPFEALALLRTGDFDQDGRDDALVEVSTMGNCCSHCYLFASVPAGGAPVVTQSFCSDKGPPAVEQKEGKPTFTVTDEDGLKTYVLEGHEARLQSERPHPTYEPVFEYTAAQLWKLAQKRREHPDATWEKLAYDLNDDGRKERIECKGWDRWKALMCYFYLGDRQVADVSGCESVGVLESKTLGMHDLVCNRRKVFRWDGSAYP